MYLFELRKLLLQMLERRGYHIGNDKVWSAHEFMAAYENERAVSKQRSAKSGVLQCLGVCVNKDATDTPPPPPPSVLDFMKWRVAAAKDNDNDNNNNNADADNSNSNSNDEDSPSSVFHQTPPDALTVLVSIESAISSDSAKLLCDYIRACDMRHVVLITAGKWNAQAHKDTVGALAAIDLEEFEADFIMQDIMASVLNPCSVRAMTDSEVHALLQLYPSFTDLTKFPNADLESPIVRYYHFRKGQVIDVRYPTNTEAPHYELVGNVK